MMKEKYSCGSMNSHTDKHSVEMGEKWGNGTYQNSIEWRLKAHQERSQWKKQGFRNKKFSYFRRGKPGSIHIVKGEGGKGNWEGPRVLRKIEVGFD